MIIFAGLRGGGSNMLWLLFNFASALEILAQQPLREMRKSRSHFQAPRQFRRDSKRLLIPICGFRVSCRRGGLHSPRPFRRAGSISHPALPTRPLQAFDHNIYRIVGMEVTAVQDGAETAILDRVNH